MRKSHLLTALFPTSRANILAACMLQPDKWWYLSELAKYLSTSPSSLQRDLKTLTSSGILEQRRDGARFYIRANAVSPIFSELRGLMEKTAGIVPALQVLLEPFRETIDCSFVFGSVASATEHAGSDVDLMVIGEIGLADLASPLRSIERKLGREVNVTVFSRREFRLKAKAGDHFVLSVLRGSKTFVKGSQRELDGIVGHQRGPETQYVQERTG